MPVATQADPARLAEYVFQHDHWPVARAIMRDVFKPHARVAVKACHASSKTFTAADCVLTALLMGGDVLTTAPTWEQVQTVLWGQVRRALQGSLIPQGEWGAVNQTDIVLATGERAVGLSTNEGVRFQGWHARPESFLLIILDEAPGVRPDIYEAIEGISAGGDVRQLLIGNPVVSSGSFYDIFTSDSPIWKRYTIDAFDTPNLAGLTLEDLLALDEDALDDNPREYLVTRRWVRDRYYEWGDGHPLWQSRVRGQFPLQADDALLSLAWLEAANAPQEFTPGAGALVAAVDVAGPGDDETVLGIRQGGNILHMESFSVADSRGPVKATLAQWAGRGLKQINVDSAGMGYHFFTSLRDWARPLGIMVNPVNVGSAPTTIKAKEKFMNLRAELYWSIRERFEAGLISGLTDRGAIAQLAGIRYEHNRRGQVEIEKKEDARKRGVKSPDRADMVMLLFAPESASQVRAEAMRGASVLRPDVPVGGKVDTSEYPDDRWRDPNAPPRVETRHRFRGGRN